MTRLALFLLTAALALARQDDATPRRYHLELTLDPSREPFAGTLRLDLDLARPLTSITLNAKDLTILDSSIEIAGDNRPLTHRIDGENIILESAESLPPGTATLTLRYTGLLRERPLLGAYRHQYNGDWYLFTTFTPIEARRVFPCFDDPHFKSAWQLELRIPRGLKAVANAPAVREQPDGTDRTRVTFAPIGPLPAELVAFAVGPFDIVDAGAAGERNIEVRVITPRGLASQAAYAGEATRQVLPRLERYTGIPFPFPKLDHLALLEGAFGAVENPGLITYRLRSLLAAPDVATVEWKRRLRGLMAHELAHQWFGNLVTQDSWEDVWLSEGFATWLGGKVMDEELPPAERRVAAVSAREQILRDDSDTAQPVRKPRSTRQELESVYNPFVYQKGAAILLMLEGWLGEEKVRQAMQSYLRGHANSTATTAALAEALRAATGQDPAGLWPTFLDRTSPPSIETSLECSPSRAAVLTVRAPAPVPVCVKAEGRPDRCALISPASPAIDLGPGCPAWFYPNAGGTGYYRTRLTGAQLESIPLSALSAPERLTLLYDAAPLRKSAGSAEAAKQILQFLNADPNPTIAAQARRLADQPE